MKGIVTPGAIPQIAMIEELKSRGIYTILADRNPKAIARPYADEFFEHSEFLTFHTGIFSIFR